MKTVHQYILGVPLAKPRVALFAASPRADYRAVVIPMQSLTRKAVLLMVFVIMVTQSLLAQMTHVGNCSYPDSMELNKLYAFIISNDTLMQELEIIRINEEQIQYSIRTNLKESAEASSQQYEGIAKWDGCYGPITADNFFYVQNWDYRSRDGSIIISVYGADLEYVILESNALSKSEMLRR